MERRAKIVATLGPSSQSPEVIERLILAGVNVCRFNFSHGTLEEHQKQIALVRSISKTLNKPVGILQDLQGPKIRAGLLAEDLDLIADENVILYSSSYEVDPNSKVKSLPVDFSELFDCVENDNRILIDDGHVVLNVLENYENYLIAKVITGGKVSSHKGINLPGVRLTIPGFTEKDRADLEFGLSQNVDFVAISFVRSAKDITRVREVIDAHEDKGLTPFIIGKLEKPEALDNLEEILQVADGVMVARGDLGVEMSPEMVPIAQKRIILEANKHGKIVITATQMLDSMIMNPLPTRAESSDVANAIFDGTDAVMLSGETANGLYPVESVQFMDRIVRSAEKNFFDWGHFSPPPYNTGDDAASITRAARELAHDLNVAAIAVFTHTGRTALLMSKSRSRVPVMAFTPTENSLGRMCLLWGIMPNYLTMSSTLREMVNKADQVFEDTNLVAKGQQIVVLSGFPANQIRHTNMAMLHIVGEKL
jgi:pyruvate kinase